MTTLRKFDTLTARSVLVSLLGIMLVHLLSLWTYEKALDRELGSIHQVRVAERLVSIKRSIGLVAPERRDSVAHDLSGGAIQAHWSSTRHGSAGGPGAEQWAGLAERVRELAPEIGTDDIVVGTGAAGDPHVGHVALRLADDSWVNVSVFASGRPHASGHGTVLSTSLMALGVVLLSILIARWLTRPIRSIAHVVGHLSPETRPVEIPVEGPAEVRELATAFNGMQHRIADLVQRRTQALAAVSHDLRTPLTRLELRIEEIADPQLRAAIVADIDEMEQMIEATLSYLKGDAASEPTRPIDLVALLETIVDDARDRGRTAELEGPAHLVVPGRLVSLKRAFTNLVENGLRFGERVTVGVRRRGDTVEVSIADDGPGIPEDQLAAVLEPFVRLDVSRNRETGGVGLGLTIAKANIEAHGGRLGLSNRPGGGLLATVTLPRPTPAPEPAMAADAGRAA